MLNLIVKDFRLLFSAQGNLRKKLLSILTTVLMMAAVVGIETYIFTTILDKIRVYHNASLPFLTLFLGIISVFMILITTLRANKLFFNQKDIEQLLRRPVSGAQIVISKLVFLFCTHYVMSLLLTYPILIAYGNLTGRSIWFYYIGVFYPALAFLFEGGVALILVYPFKLVSDFLKKHMVLQFALSLVLMVGACVLYNYVLGIFMELVVNNNVNAIFTVSSLQRLADLRRWLIPINFLADVFFASRTSMIIVYLCIAGGIFLLGAALVIFAFNYFRSITLHAQPGKAKDLLHFTTPTVALIKKEILLLFKDSNNIFSFTGMLIVQPFLVYIIIRSMNDVFSSGAFSYAMLALPELIPLLNVLIVMLFTLIINQGANEYIQTEKGNVRLMKILPVSPIKQLLIKLAVPYSLSALSLTVTVALLLATGELGPVSGICAWLLTLLLLAVFELISLKEEMHVGNNRPRSTFLSTCYSYLLPIGFFGGSIVGCIFGLDIRLAYLIGTAVFLLCSLPHAIRVRPKLEQLFLDLEMVN